MRNKDENPKVDKA